MRITVEGQLEGHPVEASWKDGELTGDPALLGWIDGLVAGGARVTLPGIITTTAGLDEPAVAAATLACAVDPGTGRLGGDRLVIEQPPPGADA